MFVYGGTLIKIYNIHYLQINIIHGFSKEPSMSTVKHSFRLCYCLTFWIAIHFYSCYHLALDIKRKRRINILILNVIKMFSKMIISNTFDRIH